MQNGKPQQLAHHVFFWLKNPDSKTDLDTLLAGIRTLAKIEQVLEIHIGVPAGVAARPVLDASYSASELILFDSVADHDAYQVHPLHQQFIAEHSHLWTKVVVYDSLDV
jgi:hypothetical protein